jgi:hypothetical protein
VLVGTYAQVSTTTRNDINGFRTNIFWDEENLGATYQSENFRGTVKVLFIANPTLQMVPPLILCRKFTRDDLRRQSQVVGAKRIGGPYLPSSRQTFPPFGQAGYRFQSEIPYISMLNAAP